MLAEDYQAVLIDLTDTSFDEQNKAVEDFLNSLNLPTTTPTSPNYIDAFARPNTANSFTNVVVSIDPSAAQYGIGVASVNNSANGNKNNYSTIQSFAGGLGL